MSQKPGKIVYTAEAIRARLDQLAAEIARDYEDRPLHLVTVLRGGLIFLGDLARRLPGDVTMDFLAVHRLEGSAPALVRDLDSPVADRHVLLVEDLVNEGRTLDYLMDLIRLQKPASLKVASMFFRPARNRTSHVIDYAGLPVPADWVVGYGLDHEQKYRNLPYLARLESC